MDGMYMPTNNAGYGQASAYPATNAPLKLRLRPEEQGYFMQCFEAAKDNATNRVEGRAAIDFFKKSKLDNATLKKIWTTAAKSSPMALNQEEFFTALRLVALTQSGREPNEASAINNSNIPLPKFESVPLPSPSVQRAESPAKMTKEEFNKCLEMYSKIDVGNAGRLTADQMTTMLKKTGLPPATLEKAWNLAEGNEDGTFDKHVVMAILYLLVKCRGGQALPPAIPSELKAAIHGFMGTPAPSVNSPVVTEVRKKSDDDPFAEITAFQTSASSKVQPLYSHPQLTAPKYSKPSESSYSKYSEPQLKPPPASMRNILPKAPSKERGPKVDPGMQSVVDEQDTELFKTARSESNEDEPRNPAKQHTDQLTSLNSEKAKLKKSITAQKAALKKEEEQMNHYQNQINKTIDEYIKCSKELEELLKKRVAVLETHSASPAKTPVQVPRSPSVDKASVKSYNAPITKPVVASGLPNPPTKTALSSPVKRPETKKVEAKPQISPKWEGFGEDAGGISWGASDFGNVGVIKGNNNNNNTYKMAGAPEFDFS